MEELATVVTALRALARRLRALGLAPEFAPHALTLKTAVAELEAVTYALERHVLANARRRG